MSRGIRALSDLKSDVILAHIVDPKGNPLPAGLDEEFARVVSAARMLDEYPDEGNVIKLMVKKYGVSKTQARTDIGHAKELFKSEHTLDWDFAFSWMVKDQIDLIKRCQEEGDLKVWNAAKKELREMIGERPVAVEDPRRMERNVFVIQVNNGVGGQVRVPLDAVRGLSAEDMRVVQESLLQPVDDAEAEEIFNS